MTRYRQVLDEAYGLDSLRVALLAVLLLRGPQTPGELRTRTARMAEFASVSAVNGELGVLAGQPEPLVRLLPRRPGQKEDRWQQLLAVEAGGTAVDVGPESTGPAGADAATTPPPVGDGVAHQPVGDGVAHQPVGDAMAHQPVGDAIGNDQPTGSTGGRGADPDLRSRVHALESEVTGLRDQIVDLRASLDALRRSLGE